MGFFFTLLFVFTAYVSPTILFGSLAQYHIEIVIAAITLFTSLLSMEDSGVSRMPQTYALIGLLGAVTMSLLLVGWMGGVYEGLVDFIPNIMVFFFVVWNCKTKRQLQMLVVVLLAAALWIVLQGHIATVNLDRNSLYVLRMRNDEGAGFFRIRGQTFLNDPNDLAQFFVALIPMLFFFWRKGSVITNLLFVYVPGFALFYGMFLTHSRGGMVAMMACVVVAGRKKVGVVPSMIVGGLIFVGLTLSGFSGGRDVGAGDDRMEAWSMGLTLIRSHPIFGVGFKRFTEYYEITAHNTIIVCAAEVGLVGLFFWMLFIFPTIRDMFVASADPADEEQKKLQDEEKQPRMPKLRRDFITVPRTKLAFSHGAEITVGGGRAPLLRAGFKPSESDVPARGVGLRSVRVAPFSPGLVDDAEEGQFKAEAEIRRMASVMMVSFAGFLAAGWFISRPYTMSLFLNAGISTVIFRLARNHGIVKETLPMGRAMRISAFLSVALVILVYVFLRVDKLFPK